MSPRIRHAEPGNHGPIIAVLDDCWGGHRRRAMLLIFVHVRPTSFVAEEDGATRDSPSHRPSRIKPTSMSSVAIASGPLPDRGTAIGRMLNERFFAAAAAAGRSEVRCVISPVNRSSVDFHRHLRFAVMPRDAEGDGVTVTRDDRAPGEDRVVLRRASGLRDCEPEPAGTGGVGEGQASLARRTRPANAVGRLKRC